MARGEIKYRDFMAKQIKPKGNGKKVPTIPDDLVSSDSLKSPSTLQRSFVDPLPLVVVIRRKYTHNTLKS